MAAEILIKGAALLALASQALALPTSQPSYDIDQSDADESHLFRRQCGVAGNIPARFRQELLSDEEGGRVHQNYQYKQLTDPLDCGDNIGCEIAATEVEGTTFSWSAGGSLDGWLSGGFEVGEYVESGQVANCQGETGETICVWWRAGYTSYRVQTWRSCFAGGADMKIREPFHVLSPNKNGMGSSYICAKGDMCRTKGFEFWNDNGEPAGGPQPFPKDKGNGLTPPA